ncbi:succinyl-diaminopimelate desuccinylase [Candidatus Comchoanobacter bicostacola]|uniref:Succinyl-diaminopimelate desuccinylase n=1 Tax=Candidatus Comchoanobacter bicostacola TaxID=2919598 RepID=A0ABY5DIJ7_9GAMM|nr:succinyl-diaminopimelate desuccinylase [Candidatus Comchoanobacter bicostacola]UTC24209.1 succinyl-diaminopimelate desuccinylase [Candidatus Comchoanobacter bicostacola]
MIHEYALLKQLITKPSITPDDSGCQSIIRQFLDFQSFDLSVNNTQNTLILTPTHGPLLLFLGHTDVVAPGSLEQWDYPPFELTKKKNKLYGRGMVDMKGALWAWCSAMKRTPTSNIQLGMLITSDEEGSGTNGIKAVIPRMKELNMLPKWVLVGEPTSKENFGDCFKNGRRGSAHFYWTIDGKQGHIAYPTHAKNPSNALQSALACIEKINHTLPANNRIEIYSINTSSHIENVIPQSITLKFNIRFTHNEIIQEVSEQLKEMPFTLECQIRAHPYQSKYGTFTDLLIHSIQDTLNTTPTPCVLGGTSDGRWLADLCPEIVEFGLKNKTAHQCNEHCTVQELHDLELIYHQLIKKTDQINSEKNLKHTITKNKTHEVPI